MPTDDRPGPDGGGSFPAGRDYGITLWQWSVDPDALANPEVLACFAPGGPGGQSGPGGTA